MRRILMILGVIVVCIGAFFIYQNNSKQRTIQNQKMFDVVMAEKMRELYIQAQDWSTPVQLEVEDDRLSGDYQLMSEFLLNYWKENIEARNHYLRQLKAAQWDAFLDVERLERDSKSNYKETEQMFSDVRRASLEYDKKRQQIQSQALADAKELSLDADLQQRLQQKLAKNMHVDPAQDIFAIEQQIIEKAQAMFDLLKKYEWQRQGKLILFHESAQVRKFNTLYQDVLKLNAQIEKIKTNNVAVLEKEL